MAGCYVEDFWPQVCPQIHVAYVEEVNLEEIVTVQLLVLSILDSLGPCKERNSVGLQEKGDRSVGHSMLYFMAILFNK